MVHLIDKDALIAEIERLACQEYNNFCDKLLDYINNLEVKEVDLESYRQAEKDNELTWKDFKEIQKITYDTSREVSLNRRGEISEKEFYQEVLKRFKERK